MDRCCYLARATAVSAVTVGLLVLAVAGGGGGTVDAVGPSLAAVVATSTPVDRYGFPIAIRPLSKPAKANASIALLGPYDLVALLSPKSWGSFAAVVKAMDAGFQLAIEDVNSDPKILPDVNVFLKRVNALVLFDDKFTGGYPAVNFYSTAVRDSTIIGGSGFLTDLAATSIGEVASQLGLPFCGAAQQSPIYSNKLVFPTFFRTTPNAGMLGPTIRLLHEKMGARRVSIISTTDYKDATDSIRRHLEMHNFDIVTRAEMKPTPTEDERNGVMNILKYEDSRYFIVLANPYDTATIYFAARNFSMVGPRYMWTAINFPYPRGESFDEDFGAGSSRDLEGLIGFSTYSNNASPYLAKFKQDYRTFQSLFPYWFFTDNGIVPILAAQTYDCVKLMLVGIDNAMKSHNATVEDLFSGRLKPFLTASAFSLPNYNGPTGAPLRLDSNGDLQTTTTILQFNTSDPTNFLEAGIVIGEVYPGESPTLRESGTLITAYGGSTKLPPDGSVERVRISNDLHHGDGLIIAILGCIGALASVAAAATSSRYANRLAFRAASPLLTATLCLGCFLIFSSAVASVDEVTSLKCRARLWLQLMGFTVFVGSIIFKVGRVALVLSSGRSLTASYFTDYVGLGVTGVLAAVEALLLGAWSIAQNPKPSFEVDAFTEKWVCRSTLPPEARYPGHIFLYVYNLLLLAGALYLALRAQSLERHYSSRAADTAAAITALSATLFLAVVALPLLETAEPGPRTDLARFAVVWAVAMFALLVIVGSKLIALGYQTRREQGELTSLDSNPASSSICRSSSSYALHRTAYCRLIPVTRVKSLPRVIYRCRAKHESFWRPWRRVHSSLLGVEKGVLLSMDGHGNAAAFLIQRNGDKTSPHLSLSRSVLTWETLNGEVVQVELEDGAAAEAYRDAMTKPF